MPESIQKGNKFSSIKAFIRRNRRRRDSEGTIVHRASLEDITGIPTIMNWVADGDIVIVEMSSIISREIELQTAVTKLQKFIEDDIKGSVLSLGHNRLLLLPSEYGSSNMESNSN